MSVSLTASQRQIQTLAPQMRQGLDILQAPAMALRELVRREAERNPLLKVEEPSAPSIDAARAEWSADGAYGGAAGVRDSAGGAGDHDSVGGAGDHDSVGGDAEPSDAQAGSPDWAGNFSSLGADGADDLYADGGNNEYNPDLDERRQFFFDSLPALESLQEHIARQLDEADISPRERQVAEQVAGSLDDSGYLRTPPEEIAQGCFASMEEVDRAIALIQGFTPSGICARSLRECLLLQLRADGDDRSPGVAAALRVCSSDAAFEAMAARKFGEVARLAGVTAEDAEKALSAVAALDPRPGRRYAAERTAFVRAEIVVTRDVETGGWNVSLDEGELPRVSLSRRWLRRRDFLKKAPPSGENPAAAAARREERRWLDANIRAGEALVFNLDQRRRTLLAISRAIVARQADFFARGPDFLRPMSMAEIAEALGLNESTVSRAVAGKWMRSPRGLHELRSFFGGGVRTEGGGETSVEAVKRRLKAMVDAEDPSEPLSDLAIAKRFADEGVVLARRTVAKYRESLKIPSSSSRRR